MAEYLSIGPVDPNTTMWMRDAVRRGELPKFNDLANPKYFPYRWGQAFWAFLGGTYGDDIVGVLLRSAGKTGNVQAALEQMTHRPADSLVSEWHRALLATAQPVAVATGVELPADRKQANALRNVPVTTSGARLLVGAGKEQRYNLAPALSPDGRRVVYLSDAGLFSIDVYLADAETGRTIRKLISSTRDPHLESLQFINSAGAWDGTGKRFVFGAIVTGKPALRIVNAENGDLEKEVTFPSLGEIFNPTWSPDGTQIAFSAQVGGLTDLFVYDLEGAKLERLTEDPYADLEPAWSPDGNSIAFVTDRFGTSLGQLTYGDYRLAVLDVRSPNPQATPLPHLANAKHINPQWSPDGRSLFFLSDPGGITNVFRLSLSDGAITQVTNVFTGISGITSLSPALSVAQKAPRAVFSVYSNGGYALQVVEDPEVLAGKALTNLPAVTAALPPVQRRAGIVAVLQDSTRGLPPETLASSPTAVRPYKARLSLDFVAQPSLAVAADRFGTYVGGGITLYWSDMLGDHNLVTMAQLNGRVQDFAGLLAYVNRRNRLNWIVAAQRIPYVTGAFAQYFDQVDGQTVLVEEVERFRQVNTELSGVLAYPFNRSQRVEFSGGMQHIGFSHELERRAIFSTGAVAFDSTIDFDAPSGLNLAIGSAALVHDNSFFGATSPILGDRWRLEASPTVGSLQFVTALADYRRYVMPFRPFTLAGRVLHVGRYGRDSDDDRMYPLFIGYPSLVRGYDIGSFDADECGNTSSNTCPVFDRLLGSRVLVGNVELRFPPLGLLHAGGGYYGALPIEAALFYDAGVAWTGAEGAQLFGNGSRKIVTSAGVSLRMNLLGYAIGQVDFVRPFDRPAKNWMVRFSLTPGF
jgi:Tol biopolymer transport system component